MLHIRTIERVDQTSTDRYVPRRELTPTVLRGCVYTGRKRVLDDQHIDYAEGRGAILWPIGLLVGLAVVVVVTQAWRVL